MKKYVLPFLFACVFIGTAGATQPGSPASGETGNTATDAPEKGWFYFEKIKKPLEPVEEPPERKNTASVKKEDADKCKKSNSWKISCGFQDPGQDFEFQALQRDELLKAMTLTNNDPKVVEQFQYYMKWVLERATQVANLWYYNMAQNPDLDPSVKQPISSFGLKLMTDVKKGQANEIYSALKSEGAFFVYFTKNDCAFCHQMQGTVEALSKETGIKVKNAALDTECLKGMTDGCLSGDAVQQPAAALQVSIVPSLFLYVPKNTWIRIATGIADGETLQSRTVSFFSAYRTALLKGINNGSGNRAPVDFSYAEDVSGVGAGVDATTAPRLPSEEELGTLLGKKQ